MTKVLSITSGAGVGSLLTMVLTLPKGPGTLIISFLTIGALDVATSTSCQNTQIMLFLQPRRLPP